WRPKPLPNLQTPAFLLLALLSACASIKPPDGGEPDRQPPHLLRIKARFVRGSWKITLRWNEYLSPASSLTPPGLWTNPSLPFRAKIAGKKVRMRIDSAQKDRPLFLWGGPGIKDFTEGNSLPPTLLLHTGDSLCTRDTLSFPALSNKSNALIWAEFRKESIIFRFLVWENKVCPLGLPLGAYHAWFWQDEDQNNRWDISETVGLLETTYVHPPDTILSSEWSVWKADTFPPKVPLPSLCGVGEGVFFFSEPIFLRGYKGQVEPLGESGIRMTEGSIAEIADSAGNSIRYEFHVAETDTRAYRPRLLWVEEVNARTPVLYLRATEPLMEARDTFWIAKVQDTSGGALLCIQGDEAWLSPLGFSSKVAVQLRTLRGETLSITIPTSKFLLRLPRDSGVVVWRVYTASGYPLVVEAGDSVWLPPGTYPALGLSAREAFWQPIRIQEGVPYRQGAQIVSYRTFTVAPHKSEADANKP
ncbi:MAG: hypothetical protein NZ580_07215, partial [Bacteroidia bacterium]|nr:hypothetical protein [Bacteroidia bacterium]MDW8236452.1 hypothetical protein [Bacteroidia bacterium]